MGICEGVIIVDRTENLRKIRRKVLTLERRRTVKKKKKEVGQWIRGLHRVEEFLDWDF